MANLSDPNNLPQLITQTWKLYQDTDDPAQEAALAAQLQELSLQLGSLADKIPDSTKQQYKDAVTAIQAATETVKQAQADEAKVAAAIGQVAQVVAALAKIATTAVSIA
jgi:hypothetical protein